MQNLVVELQAYAIDLLIGVAIVLAAGISLRVLRELGVWTPDDSRDPVEKWHQLSAAGRTAVIVIYVMSIGFFQFAFLEASAWQASVGKHLMKIHVTDLGGNRLSFLRSFLRASAKCLYNGIPYVGLASIAFIMGSTRRQAMHDFTARTIVLQGRPEAGGALQLWRVPAAFGIQYAWLIVTFMWTL
jgi:uncharacterized RDD family membrane protein YckC